MKVLFIMYHKFQRANWKCFRIGKGGQKGHNEAYADLLCDWRVQRGKTKMPGNPCGKRHRQ
jgi:hypothetical protein